VIKKILLSAESAWRSLSALWSASSSLFCILGRGEEHSAQLREEPALGKWDFGEQPVLFAVAQAIVKNDQTQSARAKALPDLQGART